jgi:pimeloyl-ACP methyl ester carboxylesterase
LAQIVLVHGAWHGGWCWSRVAEILTAKGHRVLTPTLTGLAETAHLLTPAVDLNTHIDDVVRLVDAEGLDDFVLCGHSYGGMVITGVAERIPERIGAIVYLDAFVPEDGKSCLDMSGRAPSADLALKPLSAAAFGLAGEDAAWVDAEVTPHPAATFSTKVARAGGLEKIPRKHYVLAGRWAVVQHFHAAHAAAVDDPAWAASVIDAGHELMVERPEEVAAILDAAAAG